VNVHAEQAKRGQLVDVGGYRLSVAVSGEGGPPVVYLGGLSLDDPGDDHDIDPGNEWRFMIAEAGMSTATVRYDRAGVARSDPAPEHLRPGGAVAAAAELQRLLSAVGVAEPVVLVGHSLGARVAEMFARDHPERTAGAVLIDPTPYRFGGDREDSHRREGRGGRIFDERFDVDPAAYHRPFPPVPVVVLASAVGRWLHTPAERYTLPIPMAEADKLWQRRQREAAERVAAVQVIAHTAGHAVHRDAPALVARVVEAVVLAAQQSAGLVLDPDEIDHAGGRVVLA
jgi:pimeloyl-ACP methyl ester carboxylesterase